MRVTLYGSRGCSHCRAMRQWLKARGVAFAEFDVQRSRRAAKELQRLGARSVPVLVAGDQVVHGFDEKRLQRLFPAR